MNALKYFILATDLGFVLYWIIALFQLLPENYLFIANDDTMTNAWNLSFLPIHMAISITGLHSLYLKKNEGKQWRHFALVSLALTSFSALQALTFWILINHFNLYWWICNTLMLVLPFIFIRKIVHIKKEPDFYSYSVKQYSS